MLRRCIIILILCVKTNGCSFNSCKRSKKNMLRISHFLQVQGNDVVDLEINKILNPDEYYNKYIFSEKKKKMNLINYYPIQKN